MRAPVAAMILALALGACASSSLNLPYKPEVQPSGATISAAYTIVADRLRVEIATDGRRLERAQVVRPDGALLEAQRSEEHTSELQSHLNIVCRLLLEKKKRTSTLGPH